MTEQYLTTDELANLLRVSVATLHNWRSRREGPKGIRVGRRVLYAESAVAQFLANAGDDDAA